MIAVGVSMTELTAALLSFQNHGSKMTEFALAMIIGGLAFSASLVPVIAYVLNFGVSKPRPPPSQSPEHRFNNRRFKWCFVRDIVLCLVSLSLYFVSFEFGTADVYCVGA